MMAWIARPWKTEPLFEWTNEAFGETWRAYKPCPRPPVLLSEAVLTALPDREIVTFERHIWAWKNEKIAVYTVRHDPRVEEAFAGFQLATRLFSLLLKVAAAPPPTRKNGYYWVRPPAHWTNQELFIVKWIDDRWWQDEGWSPAIAFTQVGERIRHPYEVP